MLPDSRFLQKPGSFWAAVRLISEVIGYAHDPLSVEAVTEALQHVEAKLTLKAVDGIADPTRLIARGKKQSIVHRGPLDEKTRDALLGLDPKGRKGWSKTVHALFERSRKRPWVRPDLLLKDGKPTNLRAACLRLSESQTNLPRQDRELLDEQRSS